MAIEVKSGASADILTIDPTTKAARVLLMDSAGDVLSKARNASLEGDEGVPVMGGFLPGRKARFMRLDSVGTVRAGDPAIRFVDPIELNMTTTTGNLWVQSLTTMAASVGSGVKTYNSASTTTTTTGVMDVSLQRFDRRPGRLIRHRVRAMAKWGTTVGAGTNGVVDFGFGAPASQTALAVTDGVFWRVTAAGALSLVHALSTAETTLVTLGTFSSGVITSDGSVSGFVNGQSVRVDSYYQWEIVIGDDYVFAQIVDTETGSVIFENTYHQVRTAIGHVQASHVAVFNRVFNSGAATTACQLLVTHLTVEQLDGALGMTLDDMLAGLQRTSNSVPTTQVQAANYANSAAPASATLSNTAAGYTTLGGQFQFAAVAGAETDYALFGFTVPSPYRFRCKRIIISAFNMGAAVATTAHLLQWFVSHNAATINLSTGTQWRETIGAQGIATGGTVGQPFTPPTLDWTGNKVTEPGRLIIIGLKMPVATATASQIIRGTVLVDGFFE